MCCKLQAVASLSNCSIAFVIATPLRRCIKKALTGGVLQVAVRVHGGVHDIRARLVNAKRLQKQNKDMFSPQVRQKMDRWQVLGHQWPSADFVLPLESASVSEILLSLRNERVDAGMAVFFLPRICHRVGNIIITTQWGKQVDSLDVGVDGLGFRTLQFCSFCQVYKLSADWTTSGR